MYSVMIFKRRAIDRTISDHVAAREMQDWGILIEAYLCVSDKDSFLVR